MDDLIAFVGARLNEDEAAAKARRGIFPSPCVEDDGAVWLHVKRGGNAVVAHYLHPVEGYGDMADLRAWADVEFGWTQDRVLREVGAKRQRLALYLDAGEALAAALKAAPALDDPAVAHSYVRERISVNQASGRFTAFEMSVRLDAVSWCDHPDYRPEWKP